MTQTLSRRKKRLLVTAAAAGIFATALLLIALQASRTPETYRPGEAMAGLTSDLARTLPADYPRVTFTNAAREAGIVYDHFAGRRTSQLPEDVGSGAAWGDYNRDGFPDLFVANMAGPITMTTEEVAASPAHNLLYRNNGDGTFTDVSEEAGLDLRGWFMGAAWGDYDNDGWPDLFVTAYGQNVLFHNRGDGTFVDRSAAAGMYGFEGFWASAAWGDYDVDGWLDLYVTGYVVYVPLQDGPTMTRQYDIESPASINPSSFAPERNLLFRNQGDGTFIEVAHRAGVDNAAGRSLSASWADFDEDGWPDLYVANDVSDNVLFRNLGDGLFEEISHQALVADYRGAMGLAIGDWDGDTDYDIFVTHWIAQENALYSNMRRTPKTEARTSPTPIRFMDVADRYGVGQIALDYIGWGTVFFDYDNDGRLDLFVANGSTFQEPDAPERLVPMVDQLFWNRDNQEGFFDVSGVAGPYFSESFVGRGVAAADYDLDGDVDLFIVNLDGPGVLLRNDAALAHHWIEIALDGRQSNRSAIGARLRAVAGDRVFVRAVGAQSSFGSQHSLVEHIGLGAAARIDTLEIIWPAGGRQVLTDVSSDQVLRVVEGAPLP